MAKRTETQQRELYGRSHFGTGAIFRHLSREGSADEWLCCH
ncbi:conserved protein of unknown function [Limnospira indica PCC 8005]|uniref:Uncharacterized protein n=1 Tax=Limnospira indica PCC 8005 TaxID=376219 RepID=A0A9P1KJ53_9CYAN|nr:conserved protein of unknown function [Limnospira indica PCC 8005]